MKSNRKKNRNDGESTLNNAKTNKYYNYDDDDEDEKNINTNLCSGIICTKSMFIIFNFLFIISGIMITLLGIWTLTSKQDYFVLSRSFFYESSTYILIGAGGLIILTGILGIVSAWIESKRFIILFVAICIFIFLIEISAGVLAFLYRAQLKEILNKDLKSFILNEYGEKGYEIKSQKLDDLQQNFRCCGASDFFDWQESKYVKKSNTTSAGLSYFNLVAESCCKTPSAFCAKRTHPSNIYIQGCVPELEKYLSQHILLIGVVGIGSCVFHSIGILLSFILIKRINEKNQYSSLKSNDS